MDVLETLVSFSLLMIVFSTIVSSMVEFFHRVTHQRETGLRRLVERLYDDIRGQIVPSTDGREDHDRQRDMFCRTVIENRGIPERNLQSEKSLPGNFSLVRNAIWSWFVPRQLSTLTAVELARRIAETDIGREITRRSDEVVDQTVEEISVRFQEFGEHTRAYFRQRAYALSIVFSVLLAVFANIDAVGLFDKLRQDASLRSGIIAQAEQIVGNMQSQQDAERLARENIEPSTPEERATAQKKLEENFKLLQSQKAALPIGYGLFPGCAEPERDSLCQDLNKNQLTDCNKSWFNTLCRIGVAFLEMPGQSIKWLFSVLAAGLLIGLGGPFWFNVYANLSRALGIARTVVAKKSRSESEGESEQTNVTTTDTTAPIAAFRKASKIIQTQQPRLILGSDGEPL